MKIDRIDPFHLEWAAHGTIAVATESVAIQFLCLDPEHLLSNQQVKWVRRRSPSEVDSHIISMKYGPMFTGANGGSVLSVVLQSGEVVFLEEHGDDIVCVYKSQSTQYTATCWSQSRALVGDNGGNIDWICHETFKSTRLASVPGDIGITCLAANQDCIAVVLQDNSCWIHDDSRGWQSLVPANPSRIVSITFNHNQLLIYQCGQVISASLDRSKIDTLTTHCILPGDLIPTSCNAWHIVHPNGVVSKSGLDQHTPFIEGSVECATRHPSLPIGALIVGAKQKGWAYPILSTRLVNLALYPLDEDISIPPQVVDVASPAAWLAFLVKKTDLNSYLSSQKGVGLEPTGLNPDLTLKQLFLSERFSGYRLEWYAAQDKQPVVDKMRADVRTILCNATPKSTLDKLVVDWYCGTTAAPSTFTIQGDFTAETFDGIGQAPSSVVSTNGHEWKRCALLGLPLVSIDIRKSADHQFAAYKDLPVINGANEASPIAEMLIKEATFCIFSGSLWK